MDWTQVAITSMTVVGSVTTAFLTAVYGASKKLDKVDKLEQDNASLKKSVGDLEEKLRAKGAEFDVWQQKYIATVAGWRLELDAFRDNVQEQFEHRDQLEEVRRDSVPDLGEDVRRDLERMQAQVEKLREGRGRYVHRDDFHQFTKGVDERWRGLERSLGQIEGMLRKG